MVPDRLLFAERRPDVVPAAVGAEGPGGRTGAPLYERRPGRCSDSLTVAQLVEDYIYNYHYKMFPVVRTANGGLIFTRQVKTIPREDWAKHPWRNSPTPVIWETASHPDTDALQALEIMSRTNTSRLLVTEGDHLVGVLSLKDFCNFFHSKWSWSRGPSVVSLIFIKKIFDFSCRGKYLGVCLICGRTHTGCALT